jgi:hypothetical protein
VTDPKELEDLEGLVLHPGWLRVKAMFDAEWGSAGARFEAALEKMANDADKAKAAENMQLVIWVRKEMRGFMRSIEARVSELKSRVVAEPSMSRLGVL